MQIERGKANPPPRKKVAFIPFSLFLTVPVSLSLSRVTQSTFFSLLYSIIYQEYAYFSSFVQYDRDALYMYSVEVPVPAAVRGSPLKEDFKGPPPFLTIRQKA